MARIQYSPLALVPLVAAAVSADVATGVQGGSPPSRATTLQYQSLTGPVFVPAEAGETVTLDKWASQPPGRPRLAWRPEGGTVAPVFVPDVTVAVPPLSWAPDAPDLLGRRTPSRYDSTVEPFQIEAPAETVTLDKWHSRSVDVPRRVLRPEGGTVAPLHVPDVTDPVTANAWAPTYPDRVPGLRRSVVIGGHVAPVEPVAAGAVSLDAAPGVQGGAPPARLATIQYQALAGPVVVPVAAPTVALDWFAPSALRPERDGPAIQYAPLTGPVQLVLDLDWLPTLAQPRARVTRPRSETVAPVTVPAAAPETITLDKWHSPAADVIRRVRRPSAGETVAPVETPAAAPETVTVDKWHTAQVMTPRRVLRPLGGLIGPIEPIAGGRPNGLLLRGVC